MNVFELLEQDEGLDALSRVLRNQKQMALAINDEVDQQDGEWRHFSGKAGFFIIVCLLFQGFLTTFTTTWTRPTTVWFAKRDTSG